jgi:transcriptional regulator with XRE-family HTH domain
MTIKNHADPTPEEWLDDIEGEFILDQEVTHPDPEFDDLRQRTRARLELEHDVLESLSELRRATGVNQTEIAQRWGRGQSQVSKVERSPENVELATLAGYVRALGGQLTMTIEVAGHVYHEDLVTSEKTSTKRGDVMVEKKHKVAQVPAPGGGKQDRSRDKDGEWRKKRDDTGKVRPKK